MKRAGRRRAVAVIVDERGVTLLEIVAAVAVIGIGLVGLAVVIPVSSQSVQDGGQLSTATFLAEQMMERARGTRWTADPAVDCLGVSTGDTAPLPTEPCHGARTTQFPDERDQVSGHIGYRRLVRVIDCEMAPACVGVSGPGLRRVQVSVSYVGGRSADPRTVQLEWLAARR